MDDVRPSRTVIAENVRHLRLKQGLTQAKLAELTNMPQPTIAHLERGEKEPKAVTIDALAIALGVAPATLLIPLEEEISAT